MYIASAYFPGDAEAGPPPREMDGLIQHCLRTRTPLLLGCDANAHHTVWGSTDINSRGRDLLEYLVGTDLEILNRGNNPTFRTQNRKEVLDLTLCSEALIGKVTGWKVSEEESLSDHRHVVFRWALLKPETRTGRNLRNTNRDHFKEELWRRPDPTRSWRGIHTLV